MQKRCEVHCRVGIEELMQPFPGKYVYMDIHENLC